MLTKADIKTAQGLYAHLAELRAARDAGESYYGKVSLVTDNTASKTFTVSIDKDKGLAILGEMIAATEADLNILGFDPFD